MIIIEYKKILEDSLKSEMFGDFKRLMVFLIMVNNKDIFYYIIDKLVLKYLVKVFVYYVIFWIFFILFYFLFSVVVLRI